MEKFVGKKVDIIYLDGDGKFSQRRIKVRSVAKGVVKAYCMERQSPRTFRLSNILAASPVQTLGTMYSYSRRN